MNKFTCSSCFNEIHPTRVQHGFRTCVSCASKGVGQFKYLGVMVFNHKTAGELQVMTPDVFRDFKAATNRIGQASVLRHASPTNGRLV